jgi:hypothetical protein
LRLEHLHIKMLVTTSPNQKEFRNYSFVKFVLKLWSTSDEFMTSMLFCWRYGLIIETCEVGIVTLLSESRNCCSAILRTGCFCVCFTGERQTKKLNQEILQETNFAIHGCILGEN